MLDINIILRSIAAAKSEKLAVEEVIRKQRLILTYRAWDKAAQHYLDIAETTLESLDARLAQLEEDKLHADLPSRPVIALALCPTLHGNITAGTVVSASEIPEGCRDKFASFTVETDLENLPSPVRSSPVASAFGR